MLIDGSTLFDDKAEVPKLLFVLAVTLIAAAPRLPLDTPCVLPRALCSELCLEYRNQSVSFSWARKGLPFHF